MKTRLYLILLALADGDLHGLGVARAVEELSEGQRPVSGRPPSTAPSKTS